MVLNKEQLTISHHKFKKESLTFIKEQLNLMIDKLENNYFNGDYIKFEYHKEGFVLNLNIKTTDKSKFIDE